MTNKRTTIIFVAACAALCFLLIVCICGSASVSYQYTLNATNAHFTTDTTGFYNGEDVRIRYSQKGNAVAGCRVAYTTTGFFDDFGLSTESEYSFTPSPHSMIAGSWLTENIGASNRNETECRAGVSGFRVSGRNHNLTVASETDGYMLTHGFEASGEGLAKAGYREIGPESRASGLLGTRRGTYNFSGIFEWQTAYPAGPANESFLTKPCLCPFGGPQSIGYPI